MIDNSVILKYIQFYIRAKNLKSYFSFFVIQLSLTNRAKLSLLLVWLCNILFNELYVDLVNTSLLENFDLYCNLKVHEDYKSIQNVQSAKLIIKVISFLNLEWVPAYIIRYRCVM